MKVIKWIGSILMVLGFVIAIGTAGASDTNAICIDMAIVRLLGAMAMVCVGAVAIYIVEKKEYDND